MKNINLPFVAIALIGAWFVFQKPRNSDKVMILGIVNNNNTAVIKNGYPAEDLIYITEDWKMDKMPRYLQMNPQDKEYLSRFVK